MGFLRGNAETYIENLLSNIVMISEFSEIFLYHL